MEKSDWLVEVESLEKLTKDKGQLTMLVETGLPVSFKLEGVKFEF
ncbi:hypothetical protein [Clostridium senegalense]|nr:hypothetical protein [Clostridium senegalense]